ncbi:MAG: rhodanese-like domain-containing protein [Rhizobiaceae bacterium]
MQKALWTKIGLALCWNTTALPALADPAAEIRDRRPDLFHVETGLRIEKQRSPVPDDIPAPARKIDAWQAKALIEGGAVAIDVLGALQSRYDELDGTWLVGKKRKSLPGAVWLPETGRGVLLPEIKRYLKVNLQRLTGGDKDRPLVVFCISDCWMSWNAAQHIAQFGYNDINWFPLGTDGWEEAGWTLEPIRPVPVEVD